MVAVRENVRLFNRDRVAWAASLPEDLVIATDPAWPDGGTFRGRDAAVDFVGKFEEAWSSILFEVDEFEETHGRVLTQSHWTVRGTTSGMETELDFSVVWVLRDTEVAGAHFFLDHGEALAYARENPGQG